MLVLSKLYLRTSLGYNYGVWIDEAAFLSGVFRKPSPGICARSLHDLHGVRDFSFFIKEPDEQETLVIASVSVE